MRLATRRLGDSGRNPDSDPALVGPEAGPAHAVLQVRGDSESLKHLRYPKQTCRVRQHRESMLPFCCLSKRRQAFPCLCLLKQQNPSEVGTELNQSLRYACAGHYPDRCDAEFTSVPLNFPKLCDSGCATRASARLGVLCDSRLVRLGASANPCHRSSNGSSSSKSEQQAAHEMDGKKSSHNDFGGGCNT